MAAMAMPQKCSKCRVPNKQMANLLSRNPSPNFGPSNFARPRRRRWFTSPLEPDPFGIGRRKRKCNAPSPWRQLEAVLGGETSVWPGKTTMPSSKNWRILFVLVWLRSIMTPSIVGTWDTSNWSYKTKMDKWTCSEMHAFQHRYHYDHDDNSSSWWGNWRSIKSWSFSSPRWKFSGFDVI